VPIEPGTKLGHFEVQDFIGQGAMGVVYRAYHAELARTGAVKVMQAIAPDLDATARFRREAQAIAQMRHPNILNVFDFGEYEGTPYMIVEYVAGGSLLSRMNQTPLAHATTVRYLRGIADGLDYAHAVGVVHRDIKPANILIGTDDNPIIADFGLAKLLQGSAVKSMTGVTTGTPAYMAPEQVTAGKVGPPADRYSLATIAYEMVTGLLPFEGEGVLELLYAQVHRYPPPPSERNKDLGPRVDAVIMRGLAKDPASRWESAEAFVDALEAALSGKHAVVDQTVVMAPPMEATMAVSQAAASPVAVAIPAASPPIAAPPLPVPAVGGAPLVAPRRKSHRLRNASIGCAGLLLLLILSVIGYAATHPQPTMALSSTTIQAGDRLVVSASHLPANQGGEVELLSQVRSFPFRADAHGNVTVELTVPRDIGAGDHVVKVCWSGACHNSTTLHVTAPALTSPTPSSSPNASPSPSRTPSLSSIRLSSNTVKVGTPVTVTGKDFDTSKPVMIAMVQDKVVKTLVNPVYPHSDGTFTVTVTIPSGINPGSAEIYACSYIPGQSGSSTGGCGAQPVTVTR
jgi:tRNA A-37 threonylcarbamoyl transferase component Bud32